MAAASRADVTALDHDERPLTLGEARSLYLAMGELQHEVHSLRGAILDLTEAIREFTAVAKFTP